MHDLTSGKGDLMLSSGLWTRVTQRSPGSFHTGSWELSLGLHLEFWSWIEGANRLTQYID